MSTYGLDIVYNDTGYSNEISNPKSSIDTFDCYNYYSNDR